MDNITNIYRVENYHDDVCYINCNFMDSYINKFQEIYAGIETLLIINIIFFMLFIFYLILNVRYENNILKHYFEFLKYCSILIFAVNIFYFYLFMI